MEVEMLVVQGKQRGKTLRFHRGEYLFGRGPECNVRPNSDWVSRQHCLLRVGEREVSILDLGSTNGTLVNGSRIITDHLLSSGDRIQVGPLVLELILHSEQATSETREVQALGSTVVEGDLSSPPAAPGPLEETQEYANHRSV